MFTSIKEYHQQLTDGNTSCVTVVTDYLEKIDSKKHLNAFTQVFATEALAKAAALDKQRSFSKNRGRLHGVVVAIKDVICYKEIGRAHV